MTPWIPPDIHRRSTMLGERPSALSSSLLPSFPLAISSYSPFEPAMVPRYGVCPLRALPFSLLSHLVSFDSASVAVSPRADIRT